MPKPPLAPVMRAILPVIVFFEGYDESTQNEEGSQNRQHTTINLEMLRVYRPIPKLSDMMDNYLREAVQETHRLRPRGGNIAPTAVIPRGSTVDSIHDGSSCSDGS